MGSSFLHVWFLVLGVAWLTTCQFTITTDVQQHQALPPLWGNPLLVSSVNCHRHSQHCIKQHQPCQKISYQLHGRSRAQRLLTHLFLPLQNHSAPATGSLSIQEAWPCLIEETKSAPIYIPRSSRCEPSYEPELLHGHSSGPVASEGHLSDKER